MAEQKRKPEEEITKQEAEEKPTPKPEEKEKKEELEEEIEVPKHLKKLVEEIENLKVLDLAVLVKVLEKKFGVSAIAVAPAAAPMAGASAAGAPEEEKKFFDVSLKAVGEKKIEVIKAIRDITQRGLKDSKDLVDKAAQGPQIVKEKAGAEEAQEMKKKLEEAGAQVELA